MSECFLKINSEMFIKNINKKYVPILKRTNDNKYPFFLIADL